MAQIVCKMMNSIRYVLWLAEEGRESLQYASCTPSHVEPVRIATCLSGSVRANFQKACSLHLDTVRILCLTMCTRLLAIRVVG